MSKYGFWQQYFRGVFGQSSHRFGSHRSSQDFSQSSYRPSSRRSTRSLRFRYFSIFCLLTVICASVLSGGCRREERTVSVDFVVHTDEMKVRANTPLIACMKGITREKKKIERYFLLWSDTGKSGSAEDESEETRDHSPTDETGSEPTHFEVDVIPGDYEMRYITPLNEDGSMYAVQGEESLSVTDGKKENKEQKSHDGSDDQTASQEIDVTLTYTANTEISVEQIQDTLRILESVFAGEIEVEKPEKKSEAKISVLSEDEKQSILSSVNTIYSAKKQAADEMEKTANAFIDILENPTDYVPILLSGVPHKWSYQIYSLFEDGTPCLLLNCCYSDSVTILVSDLYVGVLSEDGTRCEFINTDEPVRYGVGQGLSIGIVSLENGVIYNLGWHGHQKTGQEDKLRIVNGKLIRERIWEGRANADELPKHEPLTLTPIENKTVLYDTLAKRAGTLSFGGQYIKEKLEHPGDQIYTGTVRLFKSEDELSAFQGGANPNPSLNKNGLRYESAYAVLEMDEPTQVTAVKDGGAETEKRETTLALLDVDCQFFPQHWEQYEGKHVKVICRKPGVWALDDSLPVGAVRLNEQDLITDIIVE